MPPVPYLSPTAENTDQPPQHLQERRGVSSLHTTTHADMAHALLKARSIDTIAPALLPLEPLASFDDASAASIHLLGPSLQARHISESSSSPRVHQLSRRALETNVIPLSYNTSGAKPGVVVGAVLGAVAGFILLVWLISTLTMSRGTNVVQGSEVSEDIRVHRRSDRSRRSRRTREMSERSSVAPPPPRRRERILVEERRRTERSRPPPPPAPVEEEREVETERHDVEVEEERRVSGDDVVEVIEEQSDITPEPPRRKKSGYRTVDPNAYGGGNFPQREVDDDRRRSSRRHR
ncbi:MAG: hypothetical protein Q9159_000967 [Coniocarpon cinnabarinum]